MAHDGKFGEVENEEITKVIINKVRRILLGRVKKTIEPKMYTKRSCTHTYVEMVKVSCAKFASKM